MTLPAAFVLPAGSPSVALTAAPSTVPSSPSRRRRLWDLPTQAHELLLALSFTPEVLRREVARAVGQLRHARCVLQGRDVDVLYSAVHDMGTRNPLSELLHKRLDERHAAALLRWSGLRGTAAVQAAWHGLRDATATAHTDSSGLAADLWAALTHPLGTELQADALYDARTWVFTQARRGLQQQAHLHTQQAAVQAQLLASQRVAQQAQERCVSQQHLNQSKIAELQGALAKALADAARWQASHMQLLAHQNITPKICALQPAALLASDLPAVPALHVVPAVHVARAAPVVTPRLIERPPAATHPPDSRALWCPQPQPHQPKTSQAALPPTVQGRHVLCVGGIRRAVMRYRARVEQLGARFAHHDGGAEDGVQGLDGQLQRADVVICQAGCINHEAYHRIKRHCDRTGTPCLYVQRPSLAHFDRALAIFKEEPSQALGGSLGQGS
jgi:hypothetical protein